MALRPGWPPSNVGSSPLGTVGLGLAAPRSGPASRRSNPPRAASRARSCHGSARRACEPDDAAYQARRRATCLALVLHDLVQVQRELWVDFDDLPAVAPRAVDGQLSAVPLDRAVLRFDRFRRFLSDGFAPSTKRPHATPSTHGPLPL